MVNRGRFCAPSAIFTNSLHFPALSDTVTLHNSDLPFYYNNLIFIMDFGDDQNAFFSLANIFTFAAAVALALPAKANTWPLPSAGSRLVGENKFHVVENDGGSLEAIAKNITSAFSLCYRLTPALILTYRARVAC